MNLRNEAAVAVAACIVMGGSLLGCCAGQPPSRVGPSATVVSHCVEVSATSDGVAELRERGHTVDYSHGTWWVDGAVAATATAEDVDVRLCAEEPA